MAERPGGGRLRRVRRRQRALLAAAGAGRGADRRGEPRLSARVLPDCARVGDRLAAHHRSRPERHGVGWHEHVHDVLEGSSGSSADYNAHLVDEWLPPSTARGREARARAPRRRRRLRYGASTILMARPSRTRPSSASTTTTPRSSRPERAGEAGVGDRVDASRAQPAHDILPTRLRPRHASSTASTTSATRPARRGTSWTRLPPTARG